MESKPAFVPLKTHRLMREMLDAYYAEVKQARANGIKTVYAVGHAPTDIAVAMGFLPVYPENHATMCGAAQVATFHCQVAEEHNYSPDLCSYSKNDFGSFFAGPETKSPIGGLPKPDLLIATSMCNTHVKWFEELSRLYDVPLLVLDVPYLHDGLTEEDKARRVGYAVRQIREQWIPFLEDYCHRPFDWDKLEETVSLTSKAGRLWSDVVHSTRRVPSPITCFDIFVHLGVLMTLRGFPEAVTYYEALNAEIAERVSAGFSAVGTEKYRLYWDNIPVWFKFSYLARKFASYNACLTTAVYPRAWIDVFATEDPKRPVESIAEAQCFMFTNRGTQSRIELLTNLLAEFRVDGLVMQMSRTCKMFIPDQIAIMKAVQESTGLPAVIMEGDMVDDRLFSEAKVDNAIETFVERLEASRH